MTKQNLSLEEFLAESKEVALGTLSQSRINKLILLCRELKKQRSKYIGYAACGETFDLDDEAEDNVAMSKIINGSGD